MIGAPRWHVNATARQALDDHGVCHGNLHHIAHFDTRIAHGFGLRNRAWKAIKQETIDAIRSGNSLRDQFDNEIVGNQPALVHDCFRRDPQRRACPDGRAQHIARRDFRYAKLRGKEGGLCALACTGSPQKYESHRLLTLWRRLSGAHVPGLVAQRRWDPKALICLPTGRVHRRRSCEEFAA